ncbi:hypothetical protein [Oceanobacillus bengalensis]|uniref:Uncharacterized protein n=1 Tax=Oceanobacillus bengalensis TaxID=1435466 RepID=A0A494Z5E4_9BACI|nr:hypothetical protein [Oceanobacillus bengalensis]RKQ17536.1 hypothetical protein D8M05_03825 [Oceanobacillus bengalensis]
MQSYGKILNVTRYICGTLLTIGTIMFLYGAFVSGLSTVTGIGIGVVMGAVFIFIMGLFLEITDEMIVKKR